MRDFFPELGPLWWPECSILKGFPFTLKNMYNRADKSKVNVKEVLSCLQANYSTPKSYGTDFAASC